MKPQCTCAMSAANCGLNGCGCTTTIMDCAEHGNSEIAQKERALAEAITNTLVIAHDYKDFTEWCRKNQVNPMDPRVIFVRHENSLRGIYGPARVITTPRGYYRADIIFIRQRMRFQGILQEEQA